MNKILSLFFIMGVLFYDTATAQSPNISYPSPLTFYIGKNANPVAINNTGGAAPNKLYPQDVFYIPTSFFNSGRDFVRMLSGDIYMIADEEIYHITPDGNSTLFAGNFHNATVNGTGTDAGFQELISIDKDAAGNLYVAEPNFLDGANGKIRKITPSGVVTTYAAGLNGPAYLHVAHDGVIYVTEYSGRIMKVATDGTVSFVAGQNAIGKVDGTGANASFYTPVALVTDQAGNIFLVDNGNSLIRKITPAGVVTTFAGSTMGNTDGLGAAAKFYSPTDIAVDSHGNFIIADGNGLIRKITPAGMVTTIAQPPYYDNQNRVTSSFFPTKIVLDENDNIISFTGNGFYKVSTTGYSISPTLPAGLVFGVDGSISGTPSVLSNSNTYTVRAQNLTGNSSTTFNLEVVIPPDPPVITSFTPTAGYKDTYVTITGNYFTGTSAVTIGGKPASSFTVLSSTTISAYIADGVSSGDVTVTNLHGTATADGFTFIPAPVISSFSPTSSWKNAVVTITGTGFTGTTQVLVGGTAASSFTVVSPTQIQATLGSAGPTGDITVYAPSGNSTISGFTYINAPAVTSISPTSGGPGTTITLTGTNFTNATSITFGAIAASSFNVVSSSSITAMVAAGSANGITITTPAGTTNYSAFSYIPPPAISQPSTLKGGYNSTILINGSNLTGAQVTIGGVAATIVFNTGTQINATVGNGATSGDIVVTTSGGTSVYHGFILVPPPVITSFTPQTGAVGDIITITGTNLTEVDRVLFGGINATFTVLSSTGIQATLGSGASGYISVTSEGGTSTKPGFVHSGPTVTSFLPAQAAQGTTVVIQGTNFIGATEVDFGGVPATSFIVNSATQISAVVGAGKSGNISVITPLGTGEQAGFTHPGPSITAFSPTAAGPLSINPITITGSNFTGATAVSFGGVPASSFTVISPTQITATTVNAISGDLVVTTPQGNDKKSGFIWVQPPTISSISPTTQKNSGIITITGTNFSNITSIKIGGVSAQSYTIPSTTTITVIIGNGASGNVSVSTVGGTASLSGFTYTSPTIQSISPTSAAAGQTVTITGTNLNMVQAVKFGSTDAATFTIVSPTTITAILGSGASGSVSVSGTLGTGSITGFSFIPPPVVSSFSPNFGGNGTDISIYGLNLSGTSQVKIGGTVATITSVTSNVVTARIGAGASGSVSVTTTAGTVELAGFTWYPAPTITSADPMTAAAQTTVTITGTNFTGVTQVKFGSSTTDFTIVSPTKITAKPTLGANGSISVLGPGGTGTLPGFTFIPAPIINAFTTVGEGQGATVTISGSHFDNVTGVQFGGVPAQSYTVTSSNSITAIPGTGASGAIIVTTAGGTNSMAGFLYKKPPAVLSFSPAKGPIGTTVTIVGDYFNTTPEKNIVFFGPIKAKVTSATKTQLQVIIPAGANGLITVTDIDKKLSASSNMQFDVTNSNAFTGFSNKSEIKFGQSLSSYSFSDFDGDGQPDLLIAKDDSIYILRHGSDPVISRSSFTKKVVLETGRGSISIVVVDLDGDGKQDIVYEMAQVMAVLHNTSVGDHISFEQTILENVLNYDDYDGLTLRDMDMDGRPDLIIGTNNPIYYPNTTVGSVISFGPATALPNAGTGSNTSILIADIDGDRKPEAISGSAAATGLLIFQNNSIPGGFNFTDSRGISFRPSGLYYIDDTIITADFDGDQKVDVLENSQINNQFIVYRNTANVGAINTSSLSPAVAFSNSMMNYRTRAVDIDGDGKIDVFGVSYSDIYYAKNQSSLGNISFASPAPLISNVPNNGVQYTSINDMDGDGRMDVIVFDGDAHKLIIHHNGPVPVPQITAVSPLIAKAGTSVTITGKYFDAASAVSFGGQSASSFQVISSDTIIAVVGNGQSGNVFVQNPDGATSFPGFTFVKPPVLTSATLATDGTTVLTIKGSNLATTSVVTIAGIPATSFSIVSDSIIKATFVPVNGTLNITTVGGTASLSGISVKASQTISFEALADHAYGDGDFILNATSNNTSIPIIYSLDNQAIATINNGKIHLLKAGSVNITASQAGDSLYTAATAVKQLLKINKVPLQIKVNDTSRIYYQDNPQPIITYNGFVNGDNVSGLAAMPVVTTTATAKSAVGVYDIVPIGAAADNYYFNYQKGTLTINKAALVITAKDATRAYGKANPAFELIYNGFVNNDNSNALIIKSIITTPAVAASAVGTYDLVPSGANANNYSITYKRGKLIITPAVTNFKAAANSVTCKGQNNGSIDITATQTDNYTAIITGAGLNKTYTFTTNTTVSNLSPGNYTVCVSTSSLANYNQCFDLVITEPKDLSVYAAINKTNNTVNLSLNGSTMYEIALNGKTYNTQSNSIILPLNNGSNSLVVSTGLLCQGKIEQVINITDNRMPYPNPFQNLLYINLGENLVKKGSVKIYGVNNGVLNLKKDFSDQSGVISLNVSTFKTGVYSVHLITDSTETVYKIFKQ